ncbi:MAG: hypothetical protein Q8K36_02695, partial [Alphaproteobacteria bacterium]|nr:hypothetical protein [Alphaproteobacteria bacterium]
MLENLKNKGKILVDMRIGALIYLQLVIFGVAEPDIQPDSQGYIDGHVSRGCLYPLLLKAFFSILGQNFQVIVFFQALLGLFSIFFADYKIKKWFDFNGYIHFLIIVVFMIPYVGQTRIGSAILTEPICYPLFILFFIYYFESIKSKSYTSFIISMVLALLLTLARKQFFFIFPMVIVHQILQFYINKEFLVHKFLLPFSAIA